MESDTRSSKDKEDKDDKERRGDVRPARQPEGSELDELDNGEVPNADKTKSKPGSENTPLKRPRVVISDGDVYVNE